MSQEYFINKTRGGLGASAGRTVPVAAQAQPDLDQWDMLDRSTGYDVAADAASTAEAAVGASTHGRNNLVDFPPTMQNAQRTFTGKKLPKRKTRKPQKDFVRLTTREKLDILDQLDRKETTQADVMRKYNISRSNFPNWRRKREEWMKSQHEGESESHLLEQWDLLDQSAEHDNPDVDATYENSLGDLSPTKVDLAPIKKDAQPQRPTKGGKNLPYKRKTRRPQKETVRLSTRQKLDLLDELDKKETTQVAIMRKYNVARACFPNWRKKREEWSRLLELEPGKGEKTRVHVNDPLKRIKEGLRAYLELNIALPEESKVPVTLSVISNKALSIKDGLLESHISSPFLEDNEFKAMSSFRASESWACRWLNNSGFKPKQPSHDDEAGTVEKDDHTVTENDPDNLAPHIPQWQNSKPKQKVVVIGAGAFGTAMAYTAAQAGNDTVIYMRDADQCAAINNEDRNPKYLSDYSLRIEGGIQIRGICTADELEEELSAPGVVILPALPCQLTPPWFKEHKDAIPEDALICCAAKGLYLKTYKLMGHAIRDALGQANQPLAFLSGPSFAEEIMKSNPTALVVASDELTHAVRMQQIMRNSKTVRVSTSDDPVGVQLGGALKNPLAIGAGMLSGMGFGINTLSAMVTRASHELRQLCIAMGGNPRTIDGLAGMGDLMLTCFSSQSRNQQCGQRLMKGERIKDIQKNCTVEGIATADVAIVYADMCELELPIFRCVHSLIHKKITPEEAVLKLMGRRSRKETKGFL
eukprot:CAMPEP_0183710090 /NCGR_PEP_ID=MMETSP0737-20130205/5943_1 /TAXON_ID=385413 /ORGANISM="Thalassiosira miniscula, Strain CCMP1093" /LENGTH=756 /DNA_ID=CAMNT_0025938313 /DNA_START=74 /DNA_END=2344 /DNA_ORIENTATION=+